MSHSSPVNCSFISCTADTAVLGSMYSAVLWGFFVYFVWFTLVSSLLVMTRSKKFSLHQELAVGWIGMLFTALERGRSPFCICLAVAFTWWAEPAILIQQLGSVFQVFRDMALEQLRQRPRPCIKRPVCWEGETEATENMCWTVPVMLGWCCWWCAQQPELQPPLQCSVPRALSRLLSSREHFVGLQVTQSVQWLAWSLLPYALKVSGGWRAGEFPVVLLSLYPGKLWHLQEGTAGYVVQP